MRTNTKNTARAWLSRVRTVGRLVVRRPWLGALVLGLTSFGAQAQLTGSTYTIDPAGTVPAASGPYAGGTNFRTFTQAITALNATSLAALPAGGVTFNVAKVAFTEDAGAPNITATGSAAKPIVFQENGLTPANLADNPTVTRTTGTSATTEGVFTITGGDYITFDGINVVGSISTVEFGYLVRNTATNGAKFNTIRNARITLDRSNTSSVGVLQTSSTVGGGALSTTSPGGVNQNNVYENLTVESAYKGIYLLTGNTTPANGYDYQNIIRNCTIGQSVATAPTGSIGTSTTTTATSGIQVTRQNEVQVYNNEVQNVAVSAGAQGIWLEATYGNPNQVYGNRVHDIRNASITSTVAVYGIRLEVVATTAAGGATGHTINAYNNFVYGVTHSFSGTPSTSLRAIGIGANITTSTVAGSFINVYYNSVRMENPASFTASSGAFSQGGTVTATIPVLTLRNNIFADFSPAQSGNAAHYAIDGTGETQFGPAGSTSDYNDLYVANSAAGDNGFVGYTSTTQRRTLADYQAAVSQEANSVAADPSFASATDLHASSLLLNNAGTPAPTITTVDIDGDPRGTGAAGTSTAPDIGADEFAPIANDLAVLAITAPTSPGTAGSQPVTVSVQNNGATALSTLTLQYALNGGTAVTQNFTIPGGLASTQSTTLTFTTPANLLAGVNTLSVTGSAPNGSADPTPGNNTATATIFTPLAGVYTINKLATASPSNFVSFSAAATALNTGGISDAVRLNVLNGPYSEQFSLGEIAGVSATDTIVVDGGASKQTLTYTGTSAQPAAVLLNGADYVTLNNLTIDVSGNATYGIGVLLVGQANFNRVSNSVIRGAMAGTGSTLADIAISGGVTSAISAGSATDLRVENNTISGGYSGVIATGNASNILTGIRVTGNTITDTYTYAVDLEYTDGSVVSGNDMSRVSRASFSTFAGAYFTGTTLNALVSRNRVHDPTTAATPAGSSYGFYFTAADGTPGNGNQVINNLIYNFNGSGIHYGIYSSGSNYGLYYHNTIVFDNTASTSTSVAYGFYQTTEAEGVEFRNNIVYVTRGGTANRMAMNFNTATSSITSNHNDLYIGTGANFFTGAFAGATYVTLDDWKTANGGLYDQNSLQVDPNFVTGTLVPNSGVLNGKGDPALLPLVARDFANVLRTSPPDPGAYEFTPVSNDVAVTALTSPASPFSAGTTTVSATVQNVGGGTTTSVTLSYTYNGGTAVTQTFTGLSLAGGQSTTLTFTTPVNVLPGTATLVITATLPNNLADADNTNNTLTVTLRTALNGAYTINDQAAASSTNFVSFTAAAAALNQGGISGPVQFNVLNGPYTEQITLNQIAGVSATDTVAFNGNGRTLRFGSTDVTRKAVIQLNGTDYVTFDNLVINANHTGATYGWAVHLTNGADNNRISNCTITTGQTTVAANFNGIVASATIADQSSNGNNANGAKLEHNTITGGVYGIILSGANAAGLAGASRIIGNTVRDFYQYGILMEFQNGTLIKGNDLSRPTRTSVTAFYGIYLTGCVNTDIESNRIHDTFTGNTTSTGGAYGIYISTSDATAGAETDVVNNLLYGFNGSGAEYGLYNSNSDYVRYYHNTISLDNQAVSVTGVTKGFYQTGEANNIQFLNNVVSIRRNPGGTGEKTALDFVTPASTITSDYNDLYTGTGATYFTGSYGTANYATLANWRTANGGAYDQTSVQANPFFETNYRPTAAALNASGTPLTRVPRDLEEVTRTSPPDMGALEFTPVAEDIAVVAITSPVNNTPAGPSTVSVTIRNNGSNVLTQVTLAYSLNGGAAVTETFTGLNVASGATTTLSFAVQGTTVFGLNTITVTGSLPNGNPDADATNNAQTASFYTALAGVYTINKLAPASPTNFVSFAAAATALNQGGVSDAVRINVLNGPYNEQFSLGVIAGVSATDTIVVDGGASKQTLTYTATSAQPGAVLLNGTDYVTLNNLTIDVSSGATYGIGVLFVAQANNNRVSNCVIRAPAAATSSTANAGIAATGGVTSGSSAGDANDLRIENNVISGGYYGVTLNGLSTTVRSTGVRVTGNEIKDFYIYGLDISNSDGAQLLSNTVHRATRIAPATVSTFYGISVGASVNTTVARNRVHSPFSNYTTSTSAAYGVYFASSPATLDTENNAYNNLVYNFNGAGAEYGLYNSSSAYTRFYQNSVSLDNQANTGTAASYGYYQSGQVAGLEFVNNVVSVTRSNTGNRVAIYVATAFTTASPALVSNYNDLYVGTGSNFFTGFYTSSNSYVTLANWRTANGGAYDQNSVQVQPNFVAPLTGNLLPSATALNGAGTPATLAVVPTDFLNVTRNNPPDLGAYEFTPVTTDLTAVGLTAPLSTQTCLSATETVSVTVRNQGTAPLNFATNPATVTVNVTGAATATLTGSITTGTLAAGATRVVTLTPTLNMSAVGTYTFAITATVTGDQDTSNDLLVPSPTRTVVAPVAGALTPGSVAGCVNGSATLTLTGSANGSIQFQRSTDNLTFTDIAGATSASYAATGVAQTTYYRAQTRCGTNVATSNVVTFTINNPQVTASNSPVVVCSNSAATLTATAAAGQISFYANQTGGTALPGTTQTGTTATYTTGALTADATYYAEVTAQLSGSGTAGRVAPPSGSFTGYTLTAGLVFDVVSPFTLQTVTVYPSRATTGNIIIELQNSAGAALATSPLIPVIAGSTTVLTPQVITLNFAVPAGTGLRLVTKDVSGTTSYSLLRESSLGGYPYTSPDGNVSITTGFLTATPNASYYYFYNWQTSTLVSCTGTRTPIQVTVNPRPTFTTTSTNACAPGGTGTITVTAAAGTGTYEYSRNGGTAYQASNVFTGVPVGTYNIQVRNLGGAQCPAAATQSVTITAPAVALSVSATQTGITSVGGSEGTITATAAGGTSPYQYSINGGTDYLPVVATASAYTFTGLSAGNYTVLTRDANGCTSTTTIAVTGLADLTVSTNQPNLSGSYNNVTITGTGVATLGGNLTVNGTLTLQTNGVLNTSCQTITGPGAFTMQAGSTLSVCDAAGLSLTGANGPVQVAGTRTFSPDANYIYNGTAAQTTGAGLPATVRSLTVNNPAGVTLSQALSVTRLLTLTDGNLATGSQPLTLLSSSAGTAVVVNTNGVVTGTATVQRWINPSVNPGLGYRHYSAPVTGSTVGDLQTSGFVPVVNPAYNTAAQPGFVTPFPTVYGYDENRIVTTTSNFSDFNKGWVSPATPSDALAVTKGYTVNIAASELVDFNGTLNNGTITASGLTRGPSVDAGWHLLGNPYPSPINWNALAASDFTNLDQSVYVYRSTGQYTGQYVSFVNGIGGTQEIATGQGFFVRTSLPGTGSLRLSNAIRTTTYSNSPAFYRSADQRPLVQLDLSSAGSTDPLYVYFQAGATAGQDAGFDAVKLPNTDGLNLSAVAGMHNLSIDGLPLLGTQAVVVPLFLGSPAAGTYTLTATQLTNFTPGTAVELRDALTGTITLLTPGASYQCALPAGTIGGRFTLVFRPAAVLASQASLDAALVSLYPNPAHGRFTLQLPPVGGVSKVQATLINALGQVMTARTLPMSATGATSVFSTAELAPGVYSLTVKAGALTVTKRVVIE